MFYKVRQKPASNSAKSPPSQACQSTYPVLNWEKTLLGRLQEPIEPLSMLDEVWQKPVGPAITPAHLL